MDIIPVVSQTKPNPRHALVQAVAASLKRRCGVRGPARVLVAVSGGPDSVALLHAMKLLSTRRGWRLELAVGHVQHHLRGRRAEADAVFVENLATKLDLPFLRADLDLRRPGQRASKASKASRAASDQANLEARARQQRYAALATMAATFGAPYIATAHHADDQLETLLMRLLRGTGASGLRGIAWRRRIASPSPSAQADSEGPSPSPWRAVLIRPMLAVTHQQAVAFLESIGQAWRVDHTNEDLSRLRARLRHQVLPVLREIRPDAPHKAVAMGDYFRAVHQLIRMETQRWGPHVMRGPNGVMTLDRGQVRLMPRLILGALLRQLLREAGVPGDRLTRRALDPLLNAIRDSQGGQRRYDLARARLTITRSEVTIQPA